MEQRKKKLTRIERAKPGDPKKKQLTTLKVESRHDKLSRFAQQLGLDPSVILGKRPNPPEPSSENPEDSKHPGKEQSDLPEGEKQPETGEKPVKKLKPSTSVPTAPALPKDESLDSKRLYVYNFPYSITKEELRAVFEPYGKVSECIIPMTADNKSKGFGYVSFEDENCAIRAIAELDNQVSFGRILHIKPSEKSRRSNFDEEKKKKQEEEEKKKPPTEGSSFKKIKREEFLKNLNDDRSWNSLFLNPNTVMEYVAQEYGLSKLDLLNREVDNPAVKISLAETKIINETKEWFRENGVNLKVFETTRKSCPRSRTIVMIKNLPKDCTKARLSELLNRYGFVNRILIPANKSIAIAQFRNIDHAANAFTKLSGYSFLGSPIYLEYAPEGIISEGAMIEEETERDPIMAALKSSSQPEQREQLAEEDEQNILAARLGDHAESDRNAEMLAEIQARTVFVKNLGFDSTEDDLKAFFKEHGFSSNLIKVTKIIKKNGRSCGYGFVEFNQKDDAEKALRVANQKILSGHKLELSISRPAVKNNKAVKRLTEDVQVSNKIVIRNVDFAASKKEIRELVAAFGEVRAVRMPTKVTGEHRGYAFVEFANADEARNAYEALSHSHFYARKLVIEYAKE